MLEQELIAEAIKIQNKEKLPTKKCILKAIRKNNKLSEVCKTCMLFDITFTEFVNQINEKIKTKNYTQGE